MNLILRHGLICLILAFPFASASTYGYPKEKKPSISLVEACKIAEKIIAQLNLKGYYALNVTLLGDENQTGAGVWNLSFSNSEGKELHLGVCFPQDRVIFTGHNNDQEFFENVYTRDGSVSKWWIEQKAKMAKEEEEDRAFWDSLSDQQNKKKKTNKPDMATPRKPSD